MSATALLSMALIEPLIAVLLGAIFLHERLTLSAVGGGVLVLCSIFMITMKQLRRAAAVVALLLVSNAWALSPVALAKGYQVTLKYQWKQGDVLTYRTTLQTTSTVSGMPGTGGDLTLEQSMTQTIRMLVAAVGSDGTATIQQTIEAVKVEMATPVGRSSYDSAAARSGERDPGAEMLKTVFGGLVGGTVTVVMAPTGKVLRITGAAQLLEKIMAGLPTDPGAERMAQGLKSVLSEDAMRASLEQSFSQLAPQPVKPGDTWNGQVSLGNDTIGKIVGTQTFTLKSLDGDIAAIAVTVALKQESAPPVGPMGMTITLGESRGEGEIRFDVARGRIQRATMRTDIPSTMSMTGPDGRPATMKNTTKTSMTMELVK